MTFLASERDAQRNIQALRGFLAGIAADGRVEHAELVSLRDWLVLHRNLDSLWPFHEIGPLVARILSDGQVDDEEVREFLAYCARFDETLSGLESDLSVEVRALHGWLHGIGADERVTKSEIRALSAWLDARRYYADQWPFNELVGLVRRLVATPTDVGAAGAFYEFVRRFEERRGEKTGPDSCGVPTNRLTATDAPVLQTIAGICDTGAVVEIPTRRFCFTGAMRAMKRATAENEVKQRGGESLSYVADRLDYLVIGANSNPCWQYSTYGRKIESAMTLRQTRPRPYIVLEDVFLEALSR